MTTVDEVIARFRSREGEVPDRMRGYSVNYALPAEDMTILCDEIEKLQAILDWLDYFQDCDLAGPGLHVSELRDGWRDDRTLREALEYALEVRPIPKRARNRRRCGARHRGRCG